MSYTNRYKTDFHHVYITYIKISKNSSAKYYQNNKERLQKKYVKDIKVFLTKKKKKINNMVMNDTKVYEKMKNKSLFVEYRKNCYKMRKNALL